MSSIRKIRARTARRPQAAPVRAKPASPRRHREIISHPAIRRAQRRHFLLFDVATTLAALGAVAAFAVRGVTGLDVAIFAFMWTINVVGVELGYHRYFSHKAFEAARPLQAALLILGAIGAQGNMLSWASTHRHHHKYSDHELDVHSPRHGGFWFAHLFWKWSYDYPNPAYYCPKWLEDDFLKRVDSLYYVWVFAGLALPAALGYAFGGTASAALGGFLGGGLLRLTLGQNATWATNSICHMIGLRRYETGEGSRNHPWMTIPTLGSWLHNNHHQNQNSANLSRAWWELDPGYWLLRGFEKLGWVWKIKE